MIEVDHVLKLNFEGSQQHGCKKKRTPVITFWIASKTLKKATASKKLKKARLKISISVLSRDQKYQYKFSQSKQIHIADDFQKKSLLKDSANNQNSCPKKFHQISNITVSITSNF